MADIGLLQYRSSGELYAEEQEAERLEDESRRNERIESSIESHIMRAWSNNKMAKQDVEIRLVDCLRRRKGEYSHEKLKQISEEGGSAIFMMITATKCRAAGSWIRDILMPANESPWGLDPTPVSEVPDEFLKPVVMQIRQEMIQAQQQAQEQGAQLDMAGLIEEARKRIMGEAQEKAEEAAERHEKLIADQLAEGGWDEGLESFIDDFTTYPASIMRAPIIRRVPTLQWLEGWQPIKGYENRPEYDRVSPFDIYPSADSTNTDDGTSIIERYDFRRGELANMRGVKNWSTENLNRVLEEHGRSGLKNLLWDDNERRHLEGRHHELYTGSETIEGLIYWGNAQGLTLLQWGVHPDEIEDPLADYQVEAILIGGHVVKLKLNQDPLERRPYHRACFNPVPGSFWGIAIPELMADVQDMCNSTARSLVNNLAMSSGPQVEVYEDRLNPSEDPTDMYPWKVWRTKDNPMGSGANRAVNFFQPNSNANELLGVYEAFEIKADDATNIPRYSYGNEQVGGAGQTASGLGMLMESANKGIKDAIRHIDRGVIRRVIEGTWLYNMQNSEDNSIKGDVSVVPRGSSAMLIREQTHALRGQFLQSTANEFDMQIVGLEGRRKLLEKIAEKLDMPGLIPSKEDLENQQSQSQQMSQMIQKLEMAERQLKLQGMQADNAKKQAETKETQVDAQDKQSSSQNEQTRTQMDVEMAPLEAQSLLADIQETLAKARSYEARTGRGGREALEGTGISGGQSRGENPRGLSQVPAGATQRRA